MWMKFEVAAITLEAYYQAFLFNVKNIQHDEISIATSPNFLDKDKEKLTQKEIIGGLTELFLKLPGVVRSWHPTHSVAALGKEAHEFCGK
jgi:aminoglycoside N3'-acetyltransferase